jgi:hypothetical protein
LTSTKNKNQLFPLLYFFIKGPKTVQLRKKKEKLKHAPDKNFVQLTGTTEYAVATLVWLGARPQNALVPPCGGRYKHLLSLSLSLLYLFILLFSAWEMCLVLDGWEMFDV